MSTVIKNDTTNVTETSVPHCLDWKPCFVDLGPEMMSCPPFLNGQERCGQVSLPISETVICGKSS